MAKDGKEKTEKKARKSLNVSAEDFIRIWQSGDSIVGICAALSKKSGTEVSAIMARQRARSYRMKGVPLQDIVRSGGGPKQDWKALANVAKESLKATKK